MTIQFLDANNGALILQDTTFTNGGKVLYEGTNVNAICDTINEHGFDADNYMAGSELCESPSVINLFNYCLDICLV